jgi:hypothetical protein
MFSGLTRPGGQLWEIAVSAGSMQAGFDQDLVIENGGLGR